MSVFGKFKAHRERLEAPANTEVPKESGTGLALAPVRSMADLYGKWVPDEWIEQAHASCIRNSGLSNGRRMSPEIAKLVVTNPKSPRSATVYSITRRDRPTASSNEGASHD